VLIFYQVRDHSPFEQLLPAEYPLEDAVSHLWHGDRAIRVGGPRGICLGPRDPMVPLHPIHHRRRRGACPMQSPCPLPSRSVWLSVATRASRQRTTCGELRGVQRRGGDLCHAYPLRGRRDPTTESGLLTILIHHMAITISPYLSRDRFNQ
jgi:hypothetical protein